MLVRRIFIVGLVVSLAFFAFFPGLPHVIVRFYTVPSVQAARTSALWALIGIALLYTTAPAIATFARTGFIRSIHGTPYAEVPSWYQERRYSWMFSAPNIQNFRYADDGMPLLGEMWIKR